MELLGLAAIGSEEDSIYVKANKKKKKKKKMARVWYALKKSLLCKPEQFSVYDPAFSGKLNTVDETRSMAERSSHCTRCISSRRDVDWESKRHLENESPSSISLSGCSSSSKAKPNASQKSSSCRVKNVTISTFERPSEVSKEINGSGEETESRRYRFDEKFASFVCQICGNQFNRLDAFEAHHVTKHAVTHLVEGDSSRNVVEKICQTGWTETANETYKQIEKVLKVHNIQKFVTWFEESREIVKIEASKEPEKHPRCVADGNEILRYYGTTVACSLGMNVSSGLCTLNDCGACRILRHGFSTKKHLHGRVATFVSSTSQRALECTETYQHGHSLRKALLVCRVVAGRVHRPLEKLVEEEMTGFGFDSLAWNKGSNWITEELYVLNPRALLPCFVVIYKQY